MLVRSLHNCKHLWRTLEPCSNAGNRREPTHFSTSRAHVYHQPDCWRLLRHSACGEHDLFVGPKTCLVGGIREVHLQMHGYLVCGTISIALSAGTEVELWVPKLSYEYSNRRAGPSL